MYGEDCKQVASKKRGIKKHQIEYDFNQLLGRLIIRLDQKEVIRNTRLFKELIRESRLVQVAETGQLAVRIEKERRQLCELEKLPTGLPLAQAARGR